MRHLIWPGLSLSLLLLAGCSGGADAPLAPAASPEAAPAEGILPASTRTPDAHLGGLLQSAGTLEGASGIYRIEVDPLALTASASLSGKRQAQDTDDQYELDVAAYFQPGDVHITGVTGTATTIDLTYTVSHPFGAASTLSGPASASNRADLGIAGRVLYLVDVPTVIGATYFEGTDDVVVNTGLVVNEDGHYKPNGLIDSSALLANTFPFHALVEESLDQRRGASNGGAEDGNYDPLVGWQQGNMGVNHDAWTGYGILHQGQTVEHTVVLDRASLAGGFSFDLAIIAKYTDPRGGDSGIERRENRLPANPADVAKFVYRMPHGALDVERIAFVGESGGFIPNTISASELRFHVVDWDARATETTEADLHDDTSIQTVPSGSAGAPTLSVCIPGVLGTAADTETLSPAALSDDDSAYGGDAALDGGGALDPLFYSELVTKSVASGQVDGTYTGLVRVEDVEALSDRSEWYFPLNGALVPPLPLGPTDIKPEPVVYQAFEVVMTTPNLAPSVSFSVPPSVISGLATTVAVQVTAANDGDNDPITVEIDWDGGGDNYVNVGTINPPYAPFPTFTSPAGIWVNTTVAAVNRTINVRYSDGVIPVPITADQITSLGANRPPQVSAGTIGLAANTVPAGGNFTIQQVSALSIIDPEGDTIGFFAQGVGSPSPTLSNSGPTLPLSVGPWNVPTVTATITGYATDPLHTGTSGTLLTSTPTTLTGTLSTGFLRAWGGTGASDDTTNLNLAHDSTTGRIAVYGVYLGTMDLDPTAGVDIHTSTPAGQSNLYCTLFDANGAWLWSRVWNGTNLTTPRGICFDSSGNLVMTGSFQGTKDFNPTAGTDNRTSPTSSGIYANSLDGSGNYRWTTLTGPLLSGSISTHGDDIIQRPGSGQILVLGHTVGTGSLDFNSGAATQLYSSFSLTSMFGWGLDPATGAHTSIFGFIGSASLNVAPAAIVATPSGDVRILGSMNSASQTIELDPGPGTVNFAGAPWGCFLLALSSANAYQWHAGWAGSGPAFGNDLELRSNNDVIVAGQFLGNYDLNPGAGSVPVSNPDAAADGFMLMLSGATGSYGWSGVWDSTASTTSEIPGPLAINSADQIYVAVVADGVGTLDMDFGAGTANSSPGGLHLGVYQAATGTYVRSGRIGTAGGSGLLAQGMAITANSQPLILGDQLATTLDYDPSAGVFNYTKPAATSRHSYLLRLSPLLNF